jgi:amino acid adenylation domain-containing protein
MLSQLAGNLPPALDGAGENHPGQWLVFTDQYSIPDHQAASGLDMLASAFLQQVSARDPQQSVVLVEPGKSFQKTVAGYQVNPSSLGDMEQLFQSLDQAQALPQKIVYLWGLGKSETAVFTGLEGLLNLVKAVSKQSQLPTLQLCVVTLNAYEVTGEEALNPFQASFTALCKVISQETSNLVCRNIDLSESLDPGWASWAATGLISELVQQPGERFVAYRGRQRWAPLYDPIGENRSVPPSSLLRQNGVYLITGGLGRIGLTFAQHLAVRVQARLVLVDRFDLPPRQEWESLVQAETAEPSTLGAVLPRIKRLLEIEALGHPVLVLKADVSQPIEMQQLIGQVVEMLGGLDGIIHAAGLVGEAAIKPLAETNLETLLDQFRPKLNGLDALHTALLLSGQQPDFVFIQSSLSAVLGGLGLGAYAAANAALGLAAAQHNRRSGQSGGSNTVWVNVDWDGWQFAEPGESRLANLGSRTTVAELTMTPDEGIQVFERALSLATDGHRHLVVSTAELEPRIAQWVTQTTASRGILEDQFETGGTPEGQNQPAAAQGSGMFPRPNLQTTYVAPRNTLETQIVEAWQKILGITPVGVYDDFFELGGHSLLATQLVTRLRDTYKVELPLRRLFESPTVAGLVAMIEAAGQPVENLPVDGQPVAGDDRQAGSRDTSGQSEQILPIPRGGDLPLSFGQQRLWFIDQLEPGSPLYNNFAALRLTGDLDFNALEFCVQKIVQRHESLRTTFHEVQGQPVQTIHEQMDTPVRVTDLLGIPAEKLEEEITRLAIEEASQPFDLSQGPLLRLTVLHTASQEHVIFLTMHHIVSDGWSVGVLIREVAALYTAYKAAQAGHAVNLDQVLPELPIHYVDYATWQRSWLQGERLESQLNYWKEQLKHNPNLELFGDAPRPAVQSWHGANQWFALPESLSNALAAFNQREGVTMFMTLLAALQTLLMRYTGQEDFSIGTPVANRTRIEAESLIGFVLNTLVIRADCSGDPSFNDLLNRVRECALQAYSHQDLPFEMLVEALQPERDMSRAPFFQVIFDLQVSPLQSLKLPGLTITLIPIDSGTAKFDLALSMEEDIQGSDHQLKGYLNYNSDLFEPGTIQRMLGHFQTLLEGIIAHPDWRLSQLPLLTEAEKSLLLKTVNRSTFEARQESVGMLLPDLIHQQALKQPAATALVLADRAAPQLSYAELDRQAEELARRLVKYGVAPETLVGVCVTRSLEMIIGLLAILKAGGAFLPLDPAYPPERLAYMLEDSRSPVVLTQASLLEANPELARLFQTTPVRLVHLDALASSQPGEVDDSTTLVDGAAGPDNLAYVIYTSGSTGKPKGVMITHAVAADHCRDMARHFGIRAGDSVLQFASLNFDAGLEQVFTALISGARLVIRDEDVWTAAEFHQKIKQFGLNIINLPPAYWQPWIQYVAELEGQPSTSVSYPSLRLVIVGGDLILVDSLKYWLQSSLRQVRLLNAYGPTETTITASTFEVKDVVGDQIHTGSRYARLPIGQPHPNRTAYILDTHGKLLPVGVPGELHLGGAYLARGYLNQPALTAEKFIPDPFEPGGRLYKTGDLARRLPDGNIDFIGRIDGQVKVRGFRIELGEIEAAILTHPTIREVSVVLQTDLASGDKSLVAYIVSQDQSSGGGTGSPVELFEFLKEKLPGYMLPAAFVELDQLPLAPSGKVDRKALAARPLGEQAVQYKKRNILAPRSPLEQEVLDLWAEVLQRSVALPVSEISIEDNFFELGGHSLIATQIVSRLREKYQVDLPLRQLFENPTVAGIAGLIAQSLSKEVQDEGEEDLEALLAELEGLTEEEARLLLSGDEDSQ